MPDVTSHSKGIQKIGKFGEVSALLPMSQQ